MEPGLLAGLVIIGSMATGAIAIVGFCLHVLFTRRLDCNDVEAGSQVKSTNTIALSRTSSNRIFDISGRLPPPPPLSPPPPPGESGRVEISVISNSTSFTQFSESGYDSTQEMMSSSDDTTIPRVIFTSDFSTSSNYGSGQSSKDYIRAGDLKITGHMSPSVSIIKEEDEDGVSWLSLTDSLSRDSTTPNSNWVTLNQSSSHLNPMNVSSPTTNSSATAQLTSDRPRSNTSARGHSGATSPDNQSNQPYPISLNVPQPSTPRRSTRYLADSNNTLFYGDDSQNQPIQQSPNNSTGT